MSVGTVWGPSPAHTHKTVEARPRQLGHRRDRMGPTGDARQVGDDLSVVHVDAEDAETTALESSSDRSADPRAGSGDGDGARVAWGVGYLGPRAAVHGGTL